MRNHEKATLIAAVSIAGLGLSVGALGLANAADSTSPNTDTTISTSAPDGRGFRGGPGHGPMGHGEVSADLAKELGVTEAELQTAFEAIRDTVKPDGERPTSPPSEEERAAKQKELAAALAKELGISEEKVTAAFTKLREAREAEHRTELSTRLDGAVEEGTLTEADKESVLKAFDAGVLGGPGGPRP